MYNDIVIILILLITMSIGTMVLVLIGSAILGVIAGILSRSIFVGILFPVFLIIFLLMWRAFKKDVEPGIKGEKEQEEEITAKDVTDQQQVEPDETNQPPVSTNYPPVG